MKRAIEPTQIVYGDKRVRGHKAQCGGCGFVEKVRINSIQGGAKNSDGVEFQMAQRALEKLGWIVGNHPRSDRCPKCVDAKTKPNPEGAPEVPTPTSSPPVNPVLPVEVPIVVEVHPPVMARLDRRVIFDRLNEVYQDDKRGYSFGWTDQKVADDLGTPVEWITQVRDELFGPAVGTAILVDEKITQAKTLIGELTDLVAKLEGQR